MWDVAIAAKFMRKMCFFACRRDMCLHQARVPFVLKSKLGVSSLVRKHCLVCDVSRNLRMAPSLVGAMFLVKRELMVNVLLLLARALECTVVFILFFGCLTGGSQTNELMWDLKT